MTLSTTKGKNYDNKIPQRALSHTTTKAATSMEFIMAATLTIQTHYFP